MKFIRPGHEAGCLARARYWKMTPDETEKLSYDEQRLLNWEIKCTRPPEEQAVFIGVFMYRNGTPLDYTPMHGVVYYHNNLEPEEIPPITGYLRGRYGGKESKKGNRIFLDGSREFFDPAEIADLARSMETRFNTNSIITLEFDGMSQEEMRAAGLPDSKLLPIPSK